MPMARRVLKPLVIDPYYYHVYVVFGYDEYKYLVDKQGMPISDKLSSALGLSMECEDASGVSLCIIYLREEAEDNVIWHEALHTIHSMMESVNIPIDASTTEVQAYHQEHLVDLILKEKAKRGH